MSGGTSGRLRGLAIYAVIGQCLLHLLWHGLDPGLPAAARWPIVMLAWLPALPAFVAQWRRMPSVAFWAGLGSLFWFSHAVMALWVDAGARPFAALELLLALAAIHLASIEGLRARRAGKRR